jgi:PTS system nitrogen regulatory IIA component
MKIKDFLQPESVIPHLRASNKNQALVELSKRASESTGVDEVEILNVLLERERLGSTAVGDGIALPHGKVVGLDRLYGAFARADGPIAFDAIDGRPVDLIFMLLTPPRLNGESESIGPGLEIAT